MSLTLSLAIAIACIGIATYGLRLSLIGLEGRVRLPARVARALRYVPVAALTALVVPDLLGGATGTAAGAGLLTRDPRLWAGVVAMVVAWRTRNVLLTVAAGMVVLEVLQRVL